jgi:hypothetical protein
MRPTEVTAAFVARINAHDVVGLSEMMTDDHAFIDALDTRVAGRDAMRAGRKQYLALVPDYWIKVDAILQENGTVAPFGRAGGTYAGGNRFDAKPFPWRQCLIDARSPISTCARRAARQAARQVARDRAVVAMRLDAIEARESNAARSPTARTLRRFAAKKFNPSQTPPALHEGSR